MRPRSKCVRRPTASIVRGETDKILLRFINSIIQTSIKIWAAFIGLYNFYRSQLSSLLFAPRRSQFAASRTRHLRTGTHSHKLEFSLSHPSISQEKKIHKKVAHLLWIVFSHGWFIWSCLLASPHLTVLFRFVCLCTALQQQFVISGA